MKKTKKHTIPLSNSQKIKLHIKQKNQCIIDFLRVEMRCKHEWIKWGHGYKCEDCDYYTGMDKTLNQLINKSLKK